MKPEEIAEAKEAFSVTMSNVLTSQPFFASIFYSQNMSINWTDTLPSGAANKTAAVDGKNLFYNPKFFLKLTPPERLFLTCHEVMHIVLLHCQRSKHYADLGCGPDMKPFNGTKANHAQDYIINRMLCDDNIGKMPMGGLYHPDITADDIWDEVYCEIDDPPEDDNQGGGGEGQGFDQHLDAEQPDTGADQTQMQAAIQQAAQAAKAQGKLPGSLGKLVDALLDPKISWEDELAKEMQLNGANADVTWAKPNRRRMVTSNIIMPAKAGHTCGDIACIIDTSGSISNKEAGSFLGEIKSICENMCPENIYLLWTDADVAHVDELSDPLEIDDIIEMYTGDGAKPLPGGGGTDMPAGFAYLNDYGIKPTSCVVFTDGYTPFGDAQSYPVIWAMTTESMVGKPDHGKSIYCDIN